MSTDGWEARRRRLLSGDPEEARAARAEATTKFPIRLEFGSVTLLLHESGEIGWDAEGFKERENGELDGYFGPASRPDDAAGGTP